MGVAARTLACIADVLGAMAGEKAGLRSGPAQNVAWKGAFQLLEVFMVYCLYDANLPTKLHNRYCILLLFTSQSISGWYFT
jgi:hypothetical protein